MGSAGRRIAETAVIRPAGAEDLDELVEQTWAVAAEGRWIGIEVPLDRDARRSLLDRLSSGVSSTVLVADTSTVGGAGIVGHISIEVASYGVADIGMLVIVGWRGLALGRRCSTLPSGGRRERELTKWPSRYGLTIRPPSSSTAEPVSWRRGASISTIGVEMEKFGTPFSWGDPCRERSQRRDAGPRTTPVIAIRPAPALRGEWGGVLGAGRLAVRRT